MKLNDIIKSIDKTTKSELLKESSFASVSGFIDSGSYAINRVMTGDIHNGFPIGRITTMYGESGSGKSLFTANAVINSIKNNQVDLVYIFDSEGGTLRDYYVNSLSDAESKLIRYKLVKSIEDATVKLLALYEDLEKAHNEYLEDPANNDDIRALVVLDSLGALRSEKMLKDAAKGEAVQDMGLAAKLKNSLMSILMPMVVASNATLLVVNWEYDNPGQMFASKIKNMAGGKGVEKASHVILQCEKVMVKDGDTDFLTGKEDDSVKAGFYKGNRMKFFVRKNRVCKPCFQANVYMDFSGGISKYDGLIEDAVQFGFLQEVRGGYICPSYSDKKLFYKDIVSNDDVWNTFLEDFNRKSCEVMKYSNSITSEIDSINKSLDEKESDK